MSTVPTPVQPDNQPLVPMLLEAEKTEDNVDSFVPILLEDEKMEKNVKTSPSCGQEVTDTNQQGHLDLKFYHSPLW